MVGIVLVVPGADPGTGCTGAPKFLRKIVLAPVEEFQDVALLQLPMRIAPRSRPAIQQSPGRV
ncbi:hypothetical protein BSLA_02r1837 [Burkholderia stabilis]|nr:hypothetical protein BSLA_02r1837 [Burkholderia stabilis]